MNARKEYWKQIPPPPLKDKNLINFIQLAEKFALSVKNLFFSHSHVLTSQKLLQKEGSGKKCCFFVTKMVVLKS